MNILDFYQETDEKEENIKTYFGKLLGEKQINMKEYNYCMDVIKSGMTFKNSILFNNIMKNKEIPENLKEQIKIYDCDELVNRMKTERKNIITFNKERKIAIKKIFDMIQNNQKKIFGMYGYAGTGKTTLITEIIQFLMIHKLIKSVVLTAPTHKALNIMKTNFQKIISNLLKVNDIEDTGIFDNNILELKYKGINIDFITIHKLLHYQMEFSKYGERIFEKIKGKNDICQYDLVIIDECSMISIKMIIEIFEEIQNIIKKNDLKKIPKIIFTGDPAQLPPVNEKSSSIFIKDKNEFSFKDFLQNNPYDKSKFKTEEMVQQEYENIINSIINMETITLKKIFRNTKNNVVDLCFNIRQWVNDEIKVPKLSQFKGGGVYFYKFNPKISKNKSDWFQKCIEMIQKENCIILSWTNAATYVYNNEIRKILFGKKDLKPYEIGDILLLNDFYSVSNDIENDRFYTSEQIKILDLEIVEKTLSSIPDFSQINFSNLNDTINIIKYYKIMENQLKKFSNNIYKTWKMKVTKLNSDFINEYYIYVIHEDMKKKLEEDSENVVKIIKKLLKTYQCFNNTQINLIEKNIMKSLWKYWNENFVAQFADVIFGYSITTHKAQGSTFNNVFIDADDILTNTNLTEAKRCIYTALTRASNEIHILA
jgi:hypothetical protein